MATTTTSNVITSGAFAEYVRKQAIKSYKAKLFFSQMACKKQLPKGHHSYEFPVIDKLTGSATSLTEGVTPTEEGMNRTGKQVSLSQYGDYVILSDVLMDDNPFSLVTASIDELTHKVARTVDNAAQDVIDSGSEVIHVGQSARTAITASDVITAKTLANGVRLLNKKSAPKFDGKYYMTVMHPDTYFDLLTEVGGVGAFVDTRKHMKAEDIIEGEVGALFGTRIVVSPNVQLYADGGSGTVDVYPTFMFGKDAYGEVMSGNVETKYKSLGSSGTDDPLDQRATVASKVRVGYTILKDEGLVRIESAASEGDN